MTDLQNRLFCPDCLADAAAEGETQEYRCLVLIGFRKWQCEFCHAVFDQVTNDVPPRFERIANECRCCPQETA